MGAGRCSGAVRYCFVNVKCRGLFESFQVGWLGVTAFAFLNFWRTLGKVCKLAGQVEQR